MWIVEFSDYKNFIKARIKTLPGHGRGQASRLAEHLNVGPMVISHILTRDRHLTQEQALSTASFFGLQPKETDYFLNLVNLAKAHTSELRAFYEAKLQKMRDEEQNIRNHVAGREALSEKDKGIFYSNWYYSGVRLLTSIEGYQTVDQIADYFGLSPSRVGEILEFLLETGLCVQTDGLVRMGTKSTHVDSTSEFVNSHRKNWRDKAREKFAEPGPVDLFFSSPVSLSKKDAEDFQKELLSLIKSFSKRVVDSPEEKLMCLNLDWFEF